MDGIRDAARHGNKALTSDIFVLEEPRYCISVFVLGFPYVQQLLRPLYIYMHFFSSIFFVALGFPYVQQLLRPLYIYMHFFLQNLICSDPNLTATASPSNNLI